MTRPAAAPWTPRRRLIAGILGLMWIVIGGIFVAALLNTQPTEATYGTDGDESSITLRTDKSLAIAFLECVSFSWDARNVTLYQTREFGFPPNIQPETGTKQACNSDDARVVAEFTPDQLDHVYPQMTWINPAALLLIGIAITVIGVFLWRPIWLEPLNVTNAHLTFIPIVFSLVLLADVVNPLGVSLALIPAILILIPVSAILLLVISLSGAQTGRIYVVICAAMCAAGLLLAAYHMFTVPGMLNHDERYYASIASTGAAGFGLYPYIQNYPQMPVMGGIGHLAWLYVAAYKVFGPTVFGLRLVSWLASLAAIPAIFLLFRRWYGTATAWLAIALLPNAYMYTLSYSIRMDAFTLAWIWWGLLFVDIARRNQRWVFHLGAGLFLGVGLQAHIHTSITTIACGILYIADYIGEYRKTKQVVWPTALLAFSIGALLGLGVFIVLNVLPNPEAFLRTAGGSARLTTIKTETSDSMFERVLQSFLNIKIFIDAAIQRLIYLFQYIPLVDLTIGLMAFIGLLVRRRSIADRTAPILIFGVVAAGFFILNGPSLYYTLHLMPVVFLCVPPFFTHGNSQRGPSIISWDAVSPALVLVLVTLILPLYVSFPIISPQAMGYDVVLADLYKDEIAYLHEHVSPKCIVMGSGYIYQIALMDYPRFNASTSEGGLALHYYGMSDAKDLWPLLNPDIIFGQEEDEFSHTLSQYIDDNDYAQITPRIWQKTRGPLTEGCHITPDSP